MMVPCVIPFGENIVMTATGLEGGKAFVVVRAVGDSFIGDTDPAAAWEASERAGGPAWFLSFATSESARAMADNCKELAAALDAPA
jgi:hypothetical protein